MGKKIFKIFSISFIALCVFFYGYRLIHYYKVFNPNSLGNAKQEPLYNRIITYSYQNGDFTKNDDGYVYNYKYDKNYVKYSGLLWRIISISNEGNIRLVSEENLLSLANDNKLDESSIKKYLNDNENILYKNLEYPDSYLVNTSVCLDNINDIENITCESKEEYLIGIPSLEDYKLTGGVSGYMNSGKEYWLSNMINDALYYINKSGDVKSTKVLHYYGIKPIITINKEISYNGGTGSKEDPYIIGEKSIDILNAKHIGEYVTYNDLTWRIIDQNALGVKVALDGVLENKIAFGNNTTFKDSKIYEYLNKTYYDSLNDKEKIVMGKYYVGEYNLESNYDYKKIYEEEVEANVGLLNINDLFANDYIGTFTLTPETLGKNIIYAINEENNFYLYRSTIEMSIRPVIYLDSNIKIISGTGSKEEPYIME